MTHIILSPHPDDAALSTWRVVERERPVVVTLFASDPPSNAMPSAWDLLTGAADPALRAAERRQEDHKALDAHATVRHLQFCDHVHRASNLEAAEVADAVREAIAPCGADVVYAPLGIGGHPDHRLTRDAAMLLRDVVGELRFYADLPYAAKHGWPREVLGLEPDPYLASYLEWAEALEGLGFLQARLQLSVERLSPQQQRRKIDTLRTYRTQFSALNHGSLGRLENGHLLGYEVEWEVRR